MATPRLTMRNIREILRQKWLLNRSHREVAASLNISIGGVSKIVGKADEAALTWDAVLTLTDDELERVVYGTQKAPSATTVSFHQHSPPVSGISHQHSPSGRPVSQDHSPLAGLEFLTGIPPLAG